MTQRRRSPWKRGLTKAESAAAVVSVPAAKAEDAAQAAIKTADVDAAAAEATALIVGAHPDGA